MKKDGSLFIESSSIKSYQSFRKVRASRINVDLDLKVL